MRADICCHITVVRRLTSYNCYQTSAVITVIRRLILYVMLYNSVYNCYQTSDVRYNIRHMLDITVI